MNETESRSNAEPGPRTGPIVAGLAIILVGLAMSADRLGIPGLQLSGRSWPLFLIAFGAVRLFAPPRGRDGRAGSRWSGAWFIYLGLWFFINEFHALGFSYRTSWPLLVVGAGIGIIWRALENPGKREPRRTQEG